MEEAPFISRNLSWLDFNDRVLLESLNPCHPPLEQANFLAIVSSNLDEFFMVRVGKLETKVDSNWQNPEVGGLTPARQLEVIWQGARNQVPNQ